MARIAPLLLIVAALTAPACLAATVPQWSAKGEVTALSGRSITVRGRTCRITSVSPAHRNLRLFGVGATVRIVCKKGILRQIVNIAPKTALDTLPSASAPADTAPGGSAPLDSAPSASAPAMTPPAQPPTPGPPTVSGGAPTAVA